MLTVNAMGRDSLKFSATERVENDINAPNNNKQPLYAESEATNAGVAGAQ